MRGLANAASQDKLVRTNIGVFGALSLSMSCTLAPAFLLSLVCDAGAMNTGKSTLMNVLTQQETSIVDKHAGVTTDVKPAVMEFHRLGPVSDFFTRRESVALLR